MIIKDKKSFNGELLLQKDIRLGILNPKVIITINVILALIILLVSTYGIVQYSALIGGIWFIWGCFGGAMAHKIKMNKKSSNFKHTKTNYIGIILSIPIYVCTYAAGYINNVIYWVIKKIFKI